MYKISTMRFLLAVGLFLSLGFQAKAQYKFYITSEAADPYAFCVGNTVTFHLDYNSGYQPDSVFMQNGTTRIIADGDWTVTGRQYDFKVALKPDTYDPILHVYRNGTLSRLLLDKRISVYDNPKADFKVITDTSTCGKHVFTCLENKSTGGINKHSITNISIAWGDGETSTQLGDTLCHIYTSTGSMDHIYTVVDSKGCEDRKEVPQALDVKSSIAFASKLTVGKLDSLSQKAPLEITLKNAGSTELDSLEIATVQIVQQTDAYGYRQAFYGPYNFTKGSNGFIDPYGKLIQNLEPGKYRINMALKSHNGCQGAASANIIVGHFSKARVYYKCANEPVRFVDSTFYWNKLGQAYCDLINWHNNYTCIDTNDFFKRPKNVRKKLFGKIAGYTPPTVAERIAWDFENDGIIDLWDQHSPSHTYTSTGNKTCAIWTRDSTGEWQKSLVKFYLNEIKPAVRLESGLTYICPPQTVKLQFLDTSRVPQTIKYLWGKSSRSEIKDGYRTLNIRNIDTLSFDVETEKGCRVSFTERHLVKILGPRSSFVRLSDERLCKGDYIEYRNTSDSADYRWTVNGRIGSDSETEYFTTKDLRTNNFESYTYVTLNSSLTVFNPDIKKEEVCTTEFDPYPERYTRIFYPHSTEFEAHKRLGPAEMEFKVLDSLPENATNYYTINGGPKQLITNAVDTSRRSWYFGIDFGTYGKYEVCLYSYTSLCSDSFCTTIWTDDVGINDVSISHVKAYPNPVNDALTLSSKADGWYEIRCLTGQLLLSAKLNEGQQQIDLALLAKGSYILQVQTEDKRVSMPLVKN